MENENLIDIKALMELCNVTTPQVMLQWVKANLSKINEGEEHATKRGKSWAFDSVAVERILKLRGINTAYATISVDNEQVRQLQAEKEALQNSLDIAKGIVAQTQQTLIQLQGEHLTSVKQLAEAQRLQIEAKASKDIAEAKIEMLEAKLSELQQDHKQLQARIEGLVQANSSLLSKLQEVTAKLQAELSKGFWARLFRK